MEDEFTINLFEEPIEDGEFRTKNKEGENFRTLLVDRGERLMTKANLVGITHGMMTRDDHPATILIFEFRFIATGGRRFTRATTTLRFEDAGQQDNLDPEVVQIVPAGHFALNKTERVQAIKLGASASANIGQGPMGGEAGLVWEKQETRSSEYYTALSGAKRLLRKGWVGEDNAAVWTLEENPDKHDGIPTFVRAAVLLRRIDDVPFSFTIKIRTDVDFIGEVKTLFGLERKKEPVDPVEIDPSHSAGLGRVATLDASKYNLAELDKIFEDAAGAMVATTLDGTSLMAGPGGK